MPSFLTFSGSKAPVKNRFKRPHNLRYKSTLVKGDFQNIPGCDYFEPRNWVGYKVVFQGFKLRLHTTTNKIYIDVPNKLYSPGIKFSEIMNCLIPEKIEKLVQDLKNKCAVEISAPKLVSEPHYGAFDFEFLKSAKSCEKTYKTFQGTRFTIGNDKSKGYLEIESKAIDKEARPQAQDSIDTILDSAASIADLKSAVKEFKEKMEVTFSGLTGQQVVQALAMSAKNQELIQEEIKAIKNTFFALIIVLTILQFIFR